MRAGYREAMSLFSALSLQGLRAFGLSRDDVSRVASRCVEERDEILLGVYIELLIDVLSMRGNGVVGDEKRMRDMLGVVSSSE